jgi:hypothetical protein
MKPSGPCFSSAEIHDTCSDSTLINWLKIQPIQGISTPFGLKDSQVMPKHLSGSHALGT